MLITEQHTKVLIVGAGPSGLMMAAQLLRYGIQPLIIDSKQGPTNHSQALAVQARSLEIYRQMGLIDKVLADGKPSQGLTINMDGRQKAALSLHNIGEGQTPFPYLFVYEQSKNERLLLDYLTLNCCPVYWNTSLISLQQNPRGAEAKISNSDGEQTIKCDWVIGADGAHSVVRKQLAIPFKGDAYPHIFFLADAKLNADFLTGDQIQIYIGKNGGFAGFFAMTADKTYRVIGNLPLEFENKENLEVEEILPFLENITKAPLKIEHTNWFTTYKISHRMAERFRDQQCFLIGDAAHIHSPAGGQGMNTGLQDAYNLAWKLAGVINGNIKTTILDSYADERMPVARTLINTTDKAFNIALSSKWYALFFKKYMLFKIITAAWKSEKIKPKIFQAVSQIGISYRHSKLNLHLTNAEKIKAGDRLPYLEIYDEKKQVETDLHEWCSKPGFTLIILGKFDEMLLFNIAKWITNRYPGMLNFYYLPPSGKNLAVFDAFETDPHREKAIIVRPDMYIGYMNDLVSIALLDNYLLNVAGVVPQQNK
jgi:2-polyprenyl-6-methoxyphenol hydroxylase-like FAD-dependent oxidoreductase